MDIQKSPKKLLLKPKNDAFLEILTTVIVFLTVMKPKKRFLLLPQSNALRELCGNYFFLAEWGRGA